MADKEPRVSETSWGSKTRSQSAGGSDGCGWQTKPNRREIERTGEGARLTFLFTLSELRLSVRSACPLRIFLALRNLIWDMGLGDGAVNQSLHLVCEQFSWCLEEWWANVQKVIWKQPWVWLYTSLLVISNKKYCRCSCLKTVLFFRKIFLYGQNTVSSYNLRIRKNASEARALI